MFNLADQIDQVAVIDVNVYDGEGVAEFLVCVLLDDKLDGIHFNLLFCATGICQYKETLCPGFFYVGCCANKGLGKRFMSSWL